MNRSGHVTSFDLPFTRELHRALEKAALLSAGTRLLVAVSGGADSIALLHALATQWPALQIMGAHLNHGIRAEAAADAAFVDAFCRKLAVPLYLASVDIPEEAARTGHSLEMQARIARYAFLTKTALAQEADALLTAHTRNDQAETVLLNLCRGCGPEGLGGMVPNVVRDGIRILRPLLDLARTDVMDYLHATGTEWREDTSNQDTAFLRNRVRHELLPKIRQSLNPKVDNALAAAADRNREDNELLQGLTDAQVPIVHPDAQPQVLLRHPYCHLHPSIRRRLLVRWLLDHGHLPPEKLRAETLARIDRLAVETAGGGSIQVAASLIIRHEYDRLVLYQTIPETPPGPWPLQCPGITQVPPLGCHVTIEASTGFSHDAPGPIGQLPAAVSICPPSQTAKLALRTRRSGDRIAMLGAPGTRKLQDVFTDAKIPATQRDRIPLLTIDDEVVWFPGGRPAQTWCVAGAHGPALRITLVSV